MHKRSRLGPGLPRNYKNLLHCNYYPYQTISCKLLHKQFQFVTIKEFAQKKAAADDVLTLTGLTTLLQQNPAHCATLCNTNVGVTL